MRIGPLITGIIATAAALAALAVGGGLLLVDGEKDPDGYLTTTTERFSTETAALATDGIDLDLDHAGWLVGSEDFGKVRVRIAPEGGKPVFAGVARTADAERFLHGVSHETLTDLDVDPFAGTAKEHFGERGARRPGRSSIWAAQTTGTGRRDLTWDVEDGDWSVVVMNADGSPGVAASVEAGAKLPDLATAGWWTLGGGGFLLLVGATLIILSARPRRPRDRVGAPAVA